MASHFHQLKHSKQQLYFIQILQFYFSSDHIDDFFPSLKKLQAQDKNHFYRVLKRIAHIANQ